MAEKDKNRKIAFPVFTRPSPHEDGPSTEEVITKGSKSMPEVWEGVAKHAQEVVAAYERRSDEERNG